MGQLCTSPWANERLGDICPLPWPAYSLSKAALNAASRLLHHEMHVQQTGVAVKSLCPGDVLTGEPPHSTQRHKHASIFSISAPVWSPCHLTMFPLRRMIGIEHVVRLECGRFLMCGRYV